MCTMLRWVRHIRMLFLLLGGLACVCPSLYAAVHTGNCGANGDNVTWSYDDETKVLTISGEGAMADFANAIVVPWFSYNSAIQEINISSEITKIGKNAFNACKKVTSVEIPAKVSEFGNAAFGNNDALKDMYVSWENDADIPTISNWNNFQATIHVPCGTKSLFQSKSGWSDMIDQIAEPTYTVSVTIDDDSMGSIVITKQ